MRDPGPFYYAVKLVKNGPRVPVTVWFGNPLDPVTGEEMERAHRWCATRAGKFYDDIYAVIVEFDGLTGQPIVKGERITKAEHDHLLSVIRWAEKHDPSAPEASLRKPIDLHAQAPIF